MEEENGQAAGEIAANFTKGWQVAAADVSASCYPASPVFLPCSNSTSRALQRPLFGLKKIKKI